MATAPARVRADFYSHARAPGFLTAVAGSCILGTEFVVRWNRPAVAGALWILGIGLWLGLIYAFFFIMTIQEEKPRLDEGMNASWMLIVVSTQSVSVLGTLLAPALPFRQVVLSMTLGFFLLGCMFYVLLFWSTATWWIPLLLALGVWRHLFRRVPLRYDVQYWSMVFPVGMYAVATFRLAEALGWQFLLAVPRVAGWLALAIWLAAFIGLVRRVLTR
jgi:tellurite resistance protein TehA-like permease